MILIAGPCVIESEEHTLKMAHILTEIAAKHNVKFYFKASWDKANRSKWDSYRGVGLRKGMDILEKVKQECGCKVTSDVHEPWQIGEVKDVLDLIQIPSLLSRQTNLIMDAASTGKPVNIKKGQFMMPHDMEWAAKKASIAGCQDIMVTERGTCFGYEDIVVDMRSLMRLSGMGAKVIFDCTHSTAGNSQYAAPLAKAACAVGVDGLFVECHDDPQNALCDGPSMITPSELDALLSEVCD